MARPAAFITVLGLLPLLAACDTGPYDPAAHRQADASTGSMLSGADTGVDKNGSMSSPSLRSDFNGPRGN